MIGMCALFAPQQANADENANTSSIPPLILSEAETGQSLTPYMEYMVDVSGMATLRELFSPSYENAFTPLEEGIPLTDSGSTWLRLSIAPDSDNSHVIALGSELATDVILYIPDFSQYAENMKGSLGSDALNNALDADKAQVTTPWQEFVIPHGEAITLPAITDAKLLTQLQDLSLPVYIHMAGTPEPWFAPQLRSITDISYDNSRLIHIGIAMMLTAVLALCLLRAFTEKGQWRLWTTVFTSALLVQSLVGVPTTPHGSIGLAGLLNVLAPAVALMLLPHIARHMLRRTEFSTKYIPATGSQLDADLDQQYRFLSIPCILIAIVPLLPSMGWLGKLLPLWPLAILLFLPTTGIAVFRKIAGAKLFLFGCLVSIVGAICALIAMLMNMPATVINAIPLFGTALCALLIAGANMMHGTAKSVVSDEKNDTKHVSPVTIREDYADPLMGEGLRLVSADEGLATGVVLDGKVVENGKTPEINDTKYEPFSTSNALGEVRTVQTNAAMNAFESDTVSLAEDDQTALTNAPTCIEEDDSDKNRNIDEPIHIINDFTETEEQTSQALSVTTPLLTSAPITPVVTELPSQSLMASLRTIEQEDIHTLVRAEEAMRYPLENLRNSLDALQKHTLSPDAKTLCQEATNASKQLDLVGEDFRRAAYHLPAEPASMIFDLQSCLREAHDNVCEQSDAKNVALSWFMAPHLVQTYQGDANRLRTTLRVLMESAVDATDKGSVYLSARRVPDSTNPGHLLFTITDTGAGGPPEHRKASAVMQAWELATSTGGSLSIDSGKHGTTISFSTRFLAIHNDNAPAPHISHRSNALDPLLLLDGPSYSTSGKHARIIIGAPAASNRQLLAFYLEDTAYYPDEAASTFDIIEKYTSNGAELIILDGDITANEITKIITEARQYESENDLAPVPFLALVRDEAQADAFLHIGCTQTLLKPVTRSGLCAQAALLAPIVTLPSSIENKQNMDNSEDIASPCKTSLSPDLINSTLIEAMELLTAPAKQDIVKVTPENTEDLHATEPNLTEGQSSTAEVQEPELAIPEHALPELEVPHLESPELAGSQFESAESAISGLEIPNTPQVQEECKNTVEPQTVAPAEMPTPLAQVSPEAMPKATVKPHQANVPTSEAEDITLQIFDEYLQGEKSSVSSSMQALDPILFTDLFTDSAPKRSSKGKGLFGNTRSKQANTPISQPSSRDDDVRNSTSNEYVSAPRAVSEPVQKAAVESTASPSVATIAPAVAPIVASTVKPAVESMVASVFDPTIEQSTIPPATPTLSTQDQSEQAQSIESAMSTDHAFVYTEAESEVSAPRPIKTATEPQDTHQIKTPVSAPKQEPMEHGNEVYVEEVAVGNEVLRLYKVPTTPLNPDAEYDAMLQREAGHNEPNVMPQQNIIPQPWANASEITTDSQTMTPDSTAKSDCMAESATTTEPDTPFFTPETVEIIDTHEPIISHEQNQVSDTTQPIVEPIITPTIEPIVEPRQQAEAHQDANKENEHASYAPESVLPTEAFTAQPNNSHADVTPPTHTPPSIMQYDDRETKDEICEFSTDLSANPDTAFSKELEDVTDEEYAQFDDETESYDDDEPNIEENGPSAVQRATAALFAMCTNLREPAPLRLKEKALPSLRNIRKAFEQANTTDNSQAIENTENCDNTSTEEQGPRFVSIAQSVNELAASMKPTPSILRHSGQKDFVPQLIAELQNTMNEASTGYEQHDITMLYESAARIADTAEALGLRALERHTRCVERAAQAGDLSAAHELYPDMENVVQRTITALRSSGLNGAHRV